MRLPFGRPRFPALACCALVLALAACASPPPKEQLDAARVQELRKGQTTLDDVVRRYGRPNFLSKNWDGTQTAAYSYAAGRSAAGSLMPAVGAALGGSGDGDSFVLYFDARGILTDYKSPQAVAAAKPAPAKAPEPVQARPSDAPRLQTSVPTQIRPAEPAPPTQPTPAAAAATSPARTETPAQAKSAAKPAATTPAAAPRARDLQLPWWLPQEIRDVR